MLSDPSQLRQVLVQHTRIRVSIQSTGQRDDKYRLVCRQKNNLNRIAHILEGLWHFLWSSL